MFENMARHADLSFVEKMLLLVVMDDKMQKLVNENVINIANNVMSRIATEEIPCTLPLNYKWFTEGDGIHLWNTLTDEVALSFLVYRPDDMEEGEMHWMMFMCHLYEDALKPILQFKDDDQDEYLWWSMIDSYLANWLMAYGAVLPNKD